MKTKQNSAAEWFAHSEYVHPAGTTYDDNHQKQCSTCGSLFFFSICSASSAQFGSFIFFNCYTEEVIKQREVEKSDYSNDWD